MLQFGAALAFVPVKSNINLITFINIRIVMLIETKLSSNFICNSFVERDSLPPVILFELSVAKNHTSVST